MGAGRACSRSTPAHVATRVCDANDPDALARLSRVRSTTTGTARGVLQLPARRAAGRRSRGGPRRASSSSASGPISRRRARAARGGSRSLEEARGWPPPAIRRTGGAPAATTPRRSRDELSPVDAGRGRRAERSSRTSRRSEPRIVNGAALATLEAVFAQLHEAGFVLVNDYGPRQRGRRRGATSVFSASAAASRWG